LNIIINDITRFSRSCIYGNKLLKVCLKNKIVLHFVKENIIYDPETNYNQIQNGLETSENEWSTIRHRTISNIIYRRAQGLCLGNAPFGFDTINKKLVKNTDFNVIRLIVALRMGIKKCSEMRELLGKLVSDSSSLKFYETYYENFVPKEKEIQQFTDTFTLDFKDITKILNDYNVCNKHWQPSRVEELYKRNHLDDEFKQEFEIINKFNNNVNAIIHYMNDLSIFNDAS
jgi:hypothetical protein